jgi:hypothetical protein
MSGSFPTSPQAASINIKSFSPTFVSVSHSLKEQRRRRGGHRWLLEIDFPPMTRSEFAPIYAFAVKQRGQFEAFTYYPPTVSNPQGTATGTPLVNGDQSAGDITIVTDGWSNSITCLKAGDFLKFSGHNKVYMVVEDATSDGSGNSTLTIEPPLKADLSDNESITTGNVPFTVRFADDLVEYDGASPNIFSCSMSLIEVV